MRHARMDYQRIQDPDELIPEEEPVFLIRGQDAIGYQVVRKWAVMNEQAGGDPALTESARAHALLMEAWPKKKLADVPPGTPMAHATEVRVDIPGSADRRSHQRENVSDGMDASDIPPGSQ